MKKIAETIQMLAKQDANLCVTRDQVDKTLGHNPQELLDKYGITKNDLIRLERLGLALKARYEISHPMTKTWDLIDEKIREHNATQNGSELSLVPRRCGTHRTRWIIFQPEAA